MVAINDWFNDDEVNAPFELAGEIDHHGEPAQYQGWHYNHDYSTITVTYTGDHSKRYDCKTQQWVN